jgi:F-type H+-transporting ATPase subunit gamma
MSSGKEIKGKIRGVKQTQKITRAMEMVAASKMRRAQERMQRARPYAQKIRQVIKHIAESNPEFKHPFMEERPIKRAAYIVVSSDRGLCGGLNAKLFKELLLAIKKDRTAGIEQQFCAIGSKAENFFRRHGGKVVASATHLGDAPTVEQLIGLIKTVLDAYIAGTIDALYICSNEFVNTMVQKPQITQLLPIAEPEKDETKERKIWDYIYEPDNAREILTTLLTRYIESQVYAGVIENMASEQAARMVAMKNATENTKKMIGELQLVYNKARQAAITRELAEIVAGAAAVS